MALPKTVKYLLCYLPFILVGTGLVVFGVFMQDSARIASLIVGIVVLFSGLFAWCTDSDVGCFVVCSCWSSRDRKVSKLKKASKSTTASPSGDIEIFTIPNNRTAQSPQTTASKKTSKAGRTVKHEEEEQEGEFQEGKMLARERNNQYGQYSLHSLNKGRSFDEENGNVSRKPRFPTRAPSLDNHLNAYKPNGIHGREEMRLTIRNIQKLDKIRQGHHQSLDSDRMNAERINETQQMYNNVNNDMLDLEPLSFQKRKSIKDWISDVHDSREDITMSQESNSVWRQTRGHDSGKIQRKPLPVPPPARSASTASGSGIEIEVHSLPPSYGSDGNKSPVSGDSPDYRPQTASPEFDINEYIVTQNLQNHQSALQAALADRYV